MSMLTCRVVTGPETADGFLLAGVKVDAVTTAAETEARLKAAFEEKDCGLLLVDELLLEEVGEALLRRLERAVLPIVVPLPLDMKWCREKRGMDYLLRLIRRSIGYHMRLRK
jgi:vacuolar-type H+-ATPase subunit F/Vma7